VARRSPSTSSIEATVAEQVGEACTGVIAANFTP
jgi:hypothetical protein